jgi:hypothetical protein
MFVLGLLLVVKERRKAIHTTSTIINKPNTNNAKAPDCSGALRFYTGGVKPLDEVVVNFE